MIALIRNNQSSIEKICQRFGVARLEVFGSATSGSFDPSTSDVDLLIEFLEYGPGIATRYFGFIDAMEALLDTKVDTVFGPTVKNPILQREIDRDRECVYESPGREIAA